MDGFPSVVASSRRFAWRSAVLFGISLAMLCAGIGCGDFTLFGDDDTNQSPSAVASADDTTPLACQKDTVTLYGTESSDPDGDSLTYQWEITTRPTGSTATLQNATASQASFQPDEAGSYTIDLTVDDPSGGSDTASVTVTASSDPVADAGDDQQVSLGEEVELDGGESVNPENDCTTEGLTFSWSLSDPDGIETDLSIGEQVTFTADKEGTYTATLEVARDTDTDSDQVEIVVQAGETALEALQGGFYEFTVVTIDDGIFPFGLLETFLPPGKVLDETVDIPSLEEVPETQTISLDLGEGASVDLEVSIVQQSETDDFYTLTGTASGEVSVSVPIIGSVSCELTRADCVGQLIPVTATTVTVSLTISNPEVDSGCLDYVDKQGTIELTLSGEL